MGKRQRRRDRAQRRGPRADSRSSTVTIEFDIASVLPAGDPVGHFVVSLAAAHNDLLATHIAMFPPDEPDDPRVPSAMRVRLLRHVLAQIWETHLLVAKGVAIAEVDEFLARVGTEYPGHFDGAELISILRGEDGATRPEFREVLRAARNATDHYPKPGSRAITDALSIAAELGEAGRLIVGERMHTVRAEFADDVLMHAAFGDMSEEELGSLMEQVGRTTIAIVHLAHTSIGLWLADHDVELPDPPAD